MSKPANLIGLRFGRLVVLSRHVSIKGYVHWECVCDCGGKSYPITMSLKSGDTKSCGCLVREINSRKNRTHGMYKTREYRIYQSMKSRCYRKHMHSDRYKGRGITVCDRWLTSFENFYQDMGPCPSIKHSIERKDNDGPYSPDNCKWATAIEQAQNMCITHNITAFGKTQSLSAWGRELNINRRSILQRLKKGETLEQIVVNPPKQFYHFLTAHGFTWSLKRWAEQLGVTDGAILEHLKKGRTLEQIIGRHPYNRRIIFG